MKRWPKPWSTPSGGVDHGLGVTRDIVVPIGRLADGMMPTVANERWCRAGLVLDVHDQRVDNGKGNQGPSNEYQQDRHDRGCPRPELGDRAVCAVEPLLSGWLAEHADRHDGHPENCQTNGTDGVWGIVLSSHEWPLPAITGNMTLPKGHSMNKVTRGRSARRQSVPLNYIQTVKLRLSTIPSNTYYNN